MPAQRTLRNPPIVEALVDIRVSPALTPTTDALERVRERVLAEYPQSRPIVQHAIEVRGDNAASHRSAPEGLMLLHESGNWASHIRLGGATVSRLNGYANWDELMASTRRLWDAYADVVRPQAIVRIAVRYVNRIVVQLPARLEDYFELRPQIPQNLPQSIADVHARLVLPFPNQIFAAVTILSQPPEAGKDERVFLLDIDVFTKATLSVGDGTHWQVLDQLREIKNEVFFGSLTPQVIARYA